MLYRTIRVWPAGSGMTFDYKRSIMNFMMKSVCLMGVLFLLAGCAGCPECGSIRRRLEVSEIFLGEQIVPEYNYYFNGEITHPRAILGIDENLNVQGRFWTPIDLSQEQLSSWIAYVRLHQTQASKAYGTFRGYEILDPEGNRAGVWFSVYDWGSFRFLEDNVVEVSSPSLRPAAGTFSINLRLF